tara:strand:- start:1965 stop:3779 length:1815 start_codon:yes stop_codon:yes gene_type:complete
MKKEKKNNKNNFKQILFNIILVLLIFILIVKLFNLNNNYENSKITKESFQNNENYYNKKKFAVMWASTKNIGDDIQTLAAINLLKKNNITEYIYIDREKLSEYNGVPVVLIMNGWYMHDITKFPPSSKITPIFISVYINNEDIVKQNINYFKKYEPIGCRDTYTTNLFKKYNIKSYFSGCLTLTFDEYNKKNNKIYIVDLKGSNGGYLDEKAINFKLNYNENDIEYINHDPFFKTDDEINDVNYRMKKANELINKYKKAKLILTSRLHCVLPSRAFNTNVKFIHKNYNTDKRFKGLDVVINGGVDNIENIPSTIDRSVINNFKESIKNKFKKCIENYYIPFENFKNYILNKNIYNYWDTGVDGMKPLIKNIYYNNLKFSKKFGYNLILLTKENISDYINVPKNFYNLASNFQSDICRYYVLNKYGGIWLDSDVIIYNNMDLLVNKLGNKDMIILEEYKDNIGCAIIIAKKNTIITNFCKKYIDDVLKNKIELNWGDIGPNTIRECYKQYKKNINLFTIDKINTNMQYINWTNDPGLNTKLWYKDNIKNAKTIAINIYKELYPIIITWTIYRKKKVSDNKINEMVLYDNKSIFYHLINFNNLNIS